MFRSLSYKIAPEESSWPHDILFDSENECQEDKSPQRLIRLPSAIRWQELDHMFPYSNPHSYIEYWPHD